MIDFHFALATADLAMVVRPAFAYLDPGMGSFALQILLATLFGGLFALKQSWSIVRGWLASTIAGPHAGASATNSRPGIHGQSTAEIR